MWPEACPLSWDDTVDGYFKQKIASVINSSRKSGPYEPLSQDVFGICPSFEAVCKTHSLHSQGLLGDA